MSLERIVASKMDQEEPKTDRKSLNGEIERDEAAAVAVPTPEPLPDIFKLNIDCFEDIFDYSSIHDLITLAKTCKRLHYVAAHCFHRTYPDLEVHLICMGIGVISRGVCVEVNHFAEFIQTLVISDSIQIMPIFFKIQSKLCRLKKLLISKQKLTVDMVDRMKETLGMLEVLTVVACDLSGNLSDIIDQCAKLRFLYIHRGTVDLNWLTRKYPTLEYLKFVPYNPKPIADLTTFLELHPNIRVFGTSRRFLWENRDLLMNASNVKLRELKIIDGYGFTQHRPFFHLLNELHERGFYQRLKLQISSTEHPEQLSELNGLVKLQYYGKMDFTLSALKNLEELCIFGDENITDAENASINLVYLKRLYFSAANIDAITPFIRHSVRLQKIIVANLRSGIYFNEDTEVIDLVALNRERRKLVNAQKITLYVHGETYVATKWALRETNLESIRLMRYSFSIIDWDERLNL